MKFDWMRTGLLVAMAGLALLLVIRWNSYQELRPVTVEAPTTVQTGPATATNAEPVPVPQGAEQTTTAAISAEAGQRIEITTDTLKVSIALAGGDIVKTALPDFYAELDTPDQPFVLMTNEGGLTYMARTGFVGPNGTDSSGAARPVYRASQPRYVLGEAEDALTVTLTYQQTPTVTLYKDFKFTRGSHLIEIVHRVSNNSDSAWQAEIYGQIKRDSHNPVRTSRFGLQPFLGAATTTVETNYKKFSFDDIAEEPVSHARTGGWVAMVQHYFLTAFIPPEDANVTYKLFSPPNSNLYYLQFSGVPLAAAPGATAEQSVGFYAGPKHIRKLEAIAPYLDLTVDYSFLWWIAKPLFFTLDFIHDIVKNWGVAIILVTLLIKALFFWPSAASFKSMARMRKVQPKMQALKERYGDNKQKFSQEMMKLYKDEKVNPLGGCLPVLIQMPVFLALYWVLMEAVELRHAPFMLWIQDLSVKDPYFILPLVMGGTMFLQQRLQPTPADPTQAKVMQLMPIFFTFLFLFFPAGLVLYWVVNNSLSIAQQYVITKQIERES